MFYLHSLYVSDGRSAIPHRIHPQCTCPVTIVVGVFAQHQVGHLCERSLFLLKKGGRKEGNKKIQIMFPDDGLTVLFSSFLDYSIHIFFRNIIALKL